MKIDYLNRMDELYLCLVYQNLNEEIWGITLLEHFRLQRILINEVEE